MHFIIKYSFINENVFPLRCEKVSSLHVFNKICVLAVSIKRSKNAALQMSGQYCPCTICHVYVSSFGCNEKQFTHC